MTDTIDLTETARLRVEYDADASDPRKDWNMATGFVKIQGEGDSNLIDVEPVHDDPIGIASAHERFDSASAEWRPSPVGGSGSYVSKFSAEEAITRWARVFHNMVIEYDSENGGYWFVSPEEIAANAALGADWDTLKGQAKVIEDEQQTYRQWGAGEVYGVILERKVSLATYHVARIDEHGFEIDSTIEPTVTDTWEHVSSVWGCYLDDEYSPAMVALELDADYTDEEDAAILALLPNEYREGVLEQRRLIEARSHESLSHGRG